LSSFVLGVDPINLVVDKGCKLVQLDVELWTHNLVIGRVFVFGLEELQTSQASYENKKNLIFYQVGLDGDIAILVVFFLLLVVLI